MNGPPSPIGILLLNLGGPDSPEAVEPFLYNLFSDREIIQFPGGRALQPVWARLLARLRGPKVRENYRSIGGGSPILHWTTLQAEGLERLLNGSPGADLTPISTAGLIGTPRFRVGIAMRYWRPDTEEALRTLEREGVRRLIALTLYPHYSAATTGSSLNELRRAAEARGWGFGSAGERGLITAIDRYPEDPDYLAALTDTVVEALTQFPAETRDQAVLLFSAHGLPMKFISAGDPYVGEISRTREGVLRLLRDKGIGNPWKLGYQSRTGPVPWIGPRTDRVIEDLAREGVKAILVVPLSFVSDHIETLYEVDQLFGALAARVGVQHYRRTRMLGDDARFIEALGGLVRRHLAPEWK
jgi:protoporphyrin/coproporphyrin ferrochelatase